MSKVRIELNSKGVRELLRSPEMQNLIEARAKGMVKKRSEVEVYTAQTRVVALVRGDDGKNGALKAMGGS